MTTMTNKPVFPAVPSTTVPPGFIRPVMRTRILKIYWLVWFTNEEVIKNIAEPLKRRGECGWIEFSEWTNMLSCALK